MFRRYTNATVLVLLGINDGVSWKSVDFSAVSPFSPSMMGLQGWEGQNVLVGWCHVSVNT